MMHFFYNPRRRIFQISQDPKSFSPAKALCDDDEVTLASFGAFLVLAFNPPFSLVSLKVWLLSAALGWQVVFVSRLCCSPSR